MNPAQRTDIVAALTIPPDALVEQRVPKKLVLEQGAPTAADKRQIQDGIEGLIWVAALKPTNIGVPVFRDEVREYLEIAVLTIELRPSAQASRLVELIHRAIPYPVVLVSEHRDTITLSLAHKRWSQGETGKVVVEDVRQVLLHPTSPTPEEALFLATIAVSRLPSGNLFALYDGLLGRMAALEAARITGAFSPPESSEHGSILRGSLDERLRLERQIASLRAKVKEERQLNRRVQLNLEIKQLESTLIAVLTKLRD